MKLSFAVPVKYATEYSLRGQRHGLIYGWKQYDPSFRSRIKKMSNLNTYFREQTLQILLCQGISISTVAVV